MKHFEYLLCIDSSLSYLNELGAQGWEVVQVIVSQDSISYFLKRSYFKKAELDIYSL